MAVPAAAGRAQSVVCHRRSRWPRARNPEKSLVSLVAFGSHLPARHGSSDIGRTAVSGPFSTAESPVSSGVTRRDRSEGSMSESIQQEKKPVLRLASESPRRRQLLDLIGVPHVVTPADIDETPHASERADDYVMRLAREKAEAIWALHQDLPVLAADTTVVVDQEILGKPESEADAAAMLGKLSGREHLVHTGV